MKNIASLESSKLTDIVDKYSLFLKEIRDRLYFAFAVFALATIAGITFHEYIIRFLIEILSLKGVNIVFTSPFQFINIALSCGIATGTIAILPLLISQILSFLKPALRKKEYQLIVRFIPFSLILFVMGFTFGAFIMRWQIDIFLSQSMSLGIGNVLDISGLLTTVLLTAVFTGLCFQFPIILLLFMRIGLIHHHQLIRKRHWIYLSSFIFAMFLPADSILIDLILALPLILLFEGTLFINRFFERTRAAYGTGNI
ncbi:twin-arginine translocase subunit TatC [Candidatus Roizmanbacteria bacterium]|nr:twin-arginine translocase subunit TatC [Candidatus Roizmanbacteria bacterium]